MTEQVYKSFENTFEPNLIDEMVSIGRVINFEEGDVIIDYSQHVRYIPLLLTGAIKVLREDYDSGELLLYYLEHGDTCAMTMTCCLGEKKSEIRAVGELSGSILMIPVQKMTEWIGKYKSWLSFIFESYNNRFNELLNAVDTIAFMDMQDRVLNYLFEKSKIDKSTVVYKTHQEIANDLNTSRVVVSRLLKALELEGRVILNRSNIEILVK